MPKGRNQQKMLGGAHTGQPKSVASMVDDGERRRRSRMRLGGPGGAS